MGNSASTPEEAAVLAAWQQLPQEVLDVMKTEVLLFKERKDVAGMEYFAPDHAAMI